MAKHKPDDEPREPKADAKADTKAEASAAPAVDPAPMPTPTPGATDTDIRSQRARHEEVEAARKEAVQKDNTARLEQGRSRPPTNKEITALKKEAFGDKAGTIWVDHDLATGRTVLVYRDGDGKELRRVGWKPEADQGATSTVNKSPAKAGGK